MHIHQTIESLRNSRANHSSAAFVATMGNLHDGHISLMEIARKHAECVIASIFVNRLQFGPNEDFDKYPRSFVADCEKLSAAGVDHVFAPTEAALYPQAQNYFVMPAVAHESLLEGSVRPGHFMGVATVVTKLFNIVQPTIALFGKKDYQQLMLIRNMVKQLAMPIEIVGCDTVRAEDGLALSSRNGYLSEDERIEAPRLYQQLEKIRTAILGGCTDYRSLELEGMQVLRDHGWEPDYVAIRRQKDLQDIGLAQEPRVVLAAARLGQTRLIDNVEID